MILKDYEDSHRDISVLTDLLLDRAIDPPTRRAIANQIRNIRAGNNGEAAAAYEMKVHFDNPNWLIIHNLRIEHDGLVAQIDHLMISRLLHIWVCESKSFANGIRINEYGEFTTFYNRIPHGMPSPIEQNRRHVKILQRLIDAGAIDWPNRLGLTIKPRIRSLVLISRGAIHRPANKLPGLETVIKTDQLQTTISTAADAGNLLYLAKLIGTVTLESIGRQFMDLDRPCAFDWHARFGAKAGAPLVPAIAPTRLFEPIALDTLVENTKARSIAPDVDLPPQKIQNSVCQTCQTALTRGVASYCRSNADKFDGQMLCMKCQREPAAVTQSPATSPKPYRRSTSQTCRPISTSGTARPAASRAGS